MTDKLGVIKGHFGSLPSVKVVVLAGNKGKIPKMDGPETLSWSEMENFKSPRASLLTPYASGPAPYALALRLPVISI